jgi:hypothetical protein
VASPFEPDQELRQAIDQLQEPPVQERRSATRRSYPVVQHIAEAIDEGVPEKSAFVSVKCHDLSTRGFSFLAKRQPPFESLVLALGTPLGVIHVAAEVRHCNEAVVDAAGRVNVIQSDDTNDGEQSSGGKGITPVILVGCEFTHRLEVADW